MVGAKWIGQHWAGGPVGEAFEPRCKRTENKTPMDPTRVKLVIVKNKSSEHNEHTFARALIGAMGGRS